MFYLFSKICVVEINFIYFVLFFSTDIFLLFLFFFYLFSLKYSIVEGSFSYCSEDGGYLVLIGSLYEELFIFLHIEEPPWWKPLYILGTLFHMLILKVYNSFWCGFAHWIKILILILLSSYYIHKYICYRQYLKSGITRNAKAA